MSGIPKSLIPNQKVKSIPLKRKIIELLPANSSSATQYSPSSNSRIIFNVPAYENCSLDMSQTFLRFLATSTSANNLFKDGIPVFNRILIKSGNGSVIEDITDFHLLERVFNLLKDTTSKSVDDTLEGYYDSKVDSTDLTTADVGTLQNVGRTYIKRLCSGLFYNENSLPLHLMSGGGGFAMSIELYLNTSRESMKETATAGTAMGYSLSNVVMQLCVTELESDVCSKYDEALCSGQALKIPFSTVRSHVSSLSVQGGAIANHNIFVSESVQDLQKVFTVFRDSSASSAASANDFVLLGGQEAGVKVNTYQYRYSTNYYPAQRVDLSGGSVQSLMNVMDSLYMVKSGTPFLATSRAAGLEPRYETDAFMLVQSFEGSGDNRLISGMNTSSSGSPIQLDLTIQKPAAGAITLQAFTFVESGYNLVINPGGSVSLVNYE